MPNTKNLKQAGLKTTQPRLKVLDVLETSQNHHMTAEDVYKRLLEAEQEIGLATVYRILTQFETAGLVIRHNFEGGRALYELDNGAHHDHMVCVECGKVFEFVDRTIEQRQRNVAAKAGFTMEDHSLSLYGVCNGMKESGRCSMSKSN
jgi:Fur family ferric uptake transcriptional regulator